MKIKATKVYEESFKRQVVSEVLSGKISKEEARKRYQIGGNSTILYWIRSYAGIKMRTTGSTPTPIPEHMGTSKEIFELENKIKDLEAQLEYASLKSRAYEIMIEIAKKKYGLDLEKKSGAKQSKSSKKKTQK